MAHAMAASAASALMYNIRKVVPEIIEIMEACKTKTAGITQPSVDQIVKLSLDCGVAVRRNILGRNCGIHPENRAKSGVDPINAQNLSKQISNQGYSETKLENPMGFEKALEGELHDKQRNFNETNFAEAAGYLKAIPFRDIEYLPVTCSHTFAALNIVQGGGPGLHPEMCNEDGLIDTSKVLQLCPAWKIPIEKGIPCIVFCRELEVACPELPEFLMKAGNQSHDVHSKETKVQLMLALNQLFMSQKRLKPDGSASSAASAPWERVVKDMISMKPQFADCAAEAAKFASAWSGGDGSPALLEVEAYAKQLKTRREPENGQLGFLAGAVMQRAPKWPIACLKALLAVPDKYLSKKGEAKLFCGADIKLMETKLQEKIKKAIDLMDKAREWFGADIDSQPAVTAKLIGQLDVRLVMFVHGFKTRVTWESMDAICMDMAKEVRDLGGDMSKCPWKLKDAAAPAVSAQNAPKEYAVVEYAADGSIPQSQLKIVFGMELGTTVTLKHPGKDVGTAFVYHIAKIVGSIVTLVGTDENSSQVTTTVGELVDLYKTVTFVEDLVFRAVDIPPAETYADVVADTIRSSVKQLLYDAFRLHQPTARVDIKIKGDGAKFVFASGDYKVGGLKLVPFSKSVTVIAEGKKTKCASVEIKVPGPKGVTYVATVQTMGIGKIDRDSKEPLKDAPLAPYWLVRSVHDKTKANMGKATLTCTMTVEAGDEAVTHRVTLPIYQNIKALKGGEELVLFVEPTDNVTAQTLAQPCKKRPAAAAHRLHQPKKKRR